jgi:N-methylhydantoinase A
MALMSAASARSPSACCTVNKPASEQRIKESSRKNIHLPYLAVQRNQPCVPQYERTSTTVVNAYVTPSMVEHLNDFERQVHGRGFRGRLYTMQANGGKATYQEARRYPVQVINSGPVAGVIAGMVLAKIAGYPNVITVDMGGTSCDVALIEGGAAICSRELRRRVSGADPDHRPEHH